MPSGKHAANRSVHLSYRHAVPAVRVVSSVLHHWNISRLEFDVLLETKKVCLEFSQDSAPGYPHSMKYLSVFYSTMRCWWNQMGFGHSHVKATSIKFRYTHLDFCTGCSLFPWLLLALETDSFPLLMVASIITPQWCKQNSMIHILLVSMVSFLEKNLNDQLQITSPLPVRMSLTGCCSSSWWNSIVFLMKFADIGGETSIPC